VGVRVFTRHLDQSVTSELRGNEAARRDKAACDQVCVVPPPPPKCADVYPSTKGASCYVKAVLCSEAFSFKYCCRTQKDKCECPPQGKKACSAGLTCMSGGPHANKCMPPPPPPAPAGRRLASEPITRRRLRKRRTHSAAQAAHDMSAPFTAVGAGAGFSVTRLMPRSYEVLFVALELGNPPVRTVAMGGAAPAFGSFAHAAATDEQAAALNRASKRLLQLLQVGSLELGSDVRVEDLRITLAVDSAGVSRNNAK